MASTRRPRFDLAPGLSISRVLTGLWQIADMERDGRTLDLERAAAAMQPLRRRRADHVRHGRSLRLGRAHRRATIGARRPGAARAAAHQVGAEAGPGVARRRARRRRARAARGSRAEAIDLLQFHAWNYADPSWLETLFLLQDLKREGLIRHLGLTNVDTAHLRHGARQRDRGRLEPGVVLAARSARRPRAGAVLRRAHGVHLLAYGTRRRRLADRALARPAPSPTGSAPARGRR